MSYVRVFMVQAAKEWTFLHLAAERLRDGFVSRSRGRAANSMRAP